MFQISIDGEELDAYNVEPDETTRVRVEDIARSSGYPEACAECGEAIDDDHPDDHEPVEPALSWCNSASVTLDPDEDAVHLSCSVGDPRGAFTFTIRRIPADADNEHAGRLIIHMPHPGEGMPHETTTELRPGTLLVG